MKKHLVSFVVALCVSMVLGVSASAQYTHTNDMEGRAFHEYNMINMEGSPYLHKDWAKGNITLKNGTIYQGVNIMYDQLKDVLLFKTKDNQVKELIEPVQEFEIGYIHNNENWNRTFRKGYTGNGISENEFLEVITDGKTALLKKTTKKIFDRKNYSSATINREVQVSESYYIANGNQLVKVKKNKSSLVNAMPGKADALEGYIKSNALNLREDTDIAKLVAYYNTL